jgi:hypothetical protein
LDKLELRFKDLFEGKASIKDWLEDRPDVIRIILSEVDNYLRTRSLKEETVPGHFVFYLSEDDLASLGEVTELEVLVSEVMVSLGTEYGVGFPYSPKVKFIQRKSLHPGQIEIKSVHAADSSDRTGSFSAQSDHLKTPEVDGESKATLLLADESLICLSGPVTNLGRKSNNHIVFDDLRVSRNHAQIRHIGDDFVLFDTGSSGGTFVNGERINQSKLSSGDVISLAGVKLIFSKEETTPCQSDREITSKLGSENKEK